MCGFLCHTVKDYVGKKTNLVKQERETTVFGKLSLRYLIQNSVRADTYFYIRFGKRASILAQYNPEVKVFQFSLTLLIALLFQIFQGHVSMTLLLFQTFEDMYETNSFIS